MDPGFYDLPLKVASRDGRNFTLLEPFRFVTMEGEIIEVPAGSESDGASTPREIWITDPPFGMHWPADYLHDYLYRYSKFPKAKCDSIYLQAMKILGVSEITRLKMYEGVHLLGWKAFNDDRKQQTV